MKSYDHIIIGLGSMGAAACYYLAGRGCSVLGIEQFDPPHENGSHGGQSRIIRKAYFEHPDYIPLLHRAYDNWRHLEEKTGEEIYLRTGLFYAGPQGNALLAAIKEAAGLYRLDLQPLPLEEARRRFPQFRLPDTFEALFEPDAGLLLTDAAINAFLREAEKAGAQLRRRETVQHWEKEGEGVKVVTDKGAYYCKKLVIAAGAWSARLIPGIAGKLKVTRQVLAWSRPENEAACALGNFPCWLVAVEGKPGAYYGFPVLPGAGAFYGMKFAYHYPADACEPDAVNRAISAADTDHLEAFMHAYFGSGYGAVAAVKTCLYCNSPDEHFVIDNLPGWEDRVCVAWGFSGHGFKFVPVVGEVLADLAMYGRTTLPVDFLKATRF